MTEQTGNHELKMLCFMDETMATGKARRMEISETFAARISEKILGFFVRFDLNKIKKSSFCLG